MGAISSSHEKRMKRRLRRRPRATEPGADLDSHSDKKVKSQVSTRIVSTNDYTPSPECNDDDDSDEYNYTSNPECNDDDDFDGYMYCQPTPSTDPEQEHMEYEALHVTTMLPPPIPVRLPSDDYEVVGPSKKSAHVRLKSDVTRRDSEDGYLTMDDIQSQSNSDAAVNRPVYSVPEPNSRQRVRADRDYEASFETDMSFRRGDIMQLDRSREVEDWFYATHLLNGKEGYVPRDRITMITSVDVEKLSFFFNDLSREDAEEKLRGPGIDAGTYLLRLGRDDGCVLSLRCNGGSEAPDIRHYRIQVDEDGICRFEGKTDVRPFGNIVDLIKYCTVKPDLKCKLKEPLPREMTLEDLVINFSEIHVMLGQKLGSGNFGTVYAGTLHGDRVAVKILRASEPTMVEKIRKESETSHRLRHPNVVSLLAICGTLGSSEFYIITELMSKGSLRTLLQNDTDVSIIFRDLMDMAIQVAEGMCYLANEGFVHRDLRASNVLVGDGYVTKIADFGLTRRLDSYDEDQNEDYYQEKEEIALPVKWTAPEALARNRFTVKSDVWSFGILLYEIVTRGDEPYPGMSHVATIGWLKKDNRMTRPTKHQCPLSLYNVMNLCWTKSPKGRPDLEGIKENLIDIKMHG